MIHTFMVTYWFHTEFHRMATEINCCELKTLKLLTDDYDHTFVTMLYVISMLYPTS